MKPKRFMVSVQYGGGHHYFLGEGTEKFDLELEAKADRLLTALYKRRDAKPPAKRGAAPEIYIWEMKEHYVTVSGRDHPLIAR